MRSERPRTSIISVKFTSFDIAFVGGLLKETIRLQLWTVVLLKVVKEKLKNIIVLIKKILINEIIFIFISFYYK